MSAFDDLSEVALRSVVLDIIKPEVRPNVERELSLVLKEFKTMEDTRKGKTE
jgi:hypothetical protein